MPCMSKKSHTVHETLKNLIDCAFNAADGLVVEDNHFSSDSNRSASQREESNVHILLPEMADQIYAAKYGEWL